MFFLCMSSNVFSQSIDECLTNLSGQWSGSLTYIDFSDDVTRSSIDCQMAATWKKQTLTISIGFTEPNGKVFYDKSKIKIKEKGAQFVYNGSRYTVKEIEPRNSSKGWRITATTTAKDNQKEAAIRLILELSDEQFTMTKEVKYLNSEEYFIRNTYSFIRIN